MIFVQISHSLRILAPIRTNFPPKTYLYKISKRSEEIYYIFFSTRGKDVQNTVFQTYFKMILKFNFDMIYRKFIKNKWSSPPHFFSKIISYKKDISVIIFIFSKILKIFKFSKFFKFFKSSKIFKNFFFN